MKLIEKKNYHESETYNFQKSIISYGGVYLYKESESSGFVVGLRLFDRIIRFKYRKNKNREIFKELFYVEVDNKNKKIWWTFSNFNILPLKWNKSLSKEEIINEDLFREIVRNNK